VPVGVQYAGEQFVRPAVLLGRDLGAQHGPGQVRRHLDALAAHHEQAAVTGLLQRVGRQVGAGGGVEFQVLVGHREQHDQARVRRQGVEPVPQAGAQGAVRPQVPGAGEFGERQRVAAREVEHLLGEVLRHAQRVVVAEHRERGGVVQRAQRQDGETGERVVAAVGFQREQHGDPVVGDAAGEERQRLQRRPVEQARVVDEHEHRALRRHVAHQPVDLGVQRERAARCARRQPDRDAQRLGDALGQRVQQAVQTRQVERGLSRHAVRRQHPEVRGAGEFEQGGLARAGTAGEHERGSSTGTGGVEQVQHGGALLVTSAQNDLRSHTGQCCADVTKWGRAGANLPIIVSFGFDDW
jgi:hypothetical protein